MDEKGEGGFDAKGATVEVEEDGEFVVSVVGFGKENASGDVGVVCDDYVFG